MKYVYLALFIIMGTAAKGQDCSQIKTEIDKFNDDTSHWTPLLRTMSITRVNSASGKKYIYLSIEVEGATAVSGASGVYILFSDSTKLKFPDQKVDLKYNDGYKYTAFIAITEAQLSQLAKKAVTDVRLYIFDMALPSEEAEEFLANAACIKTK